MAEPAEGESLQKWARIALGLAVGAFGFSIWLWLSHPPRKPGAASTASTATPDVAAGVDCAKMAAAVGRSGLDSNLRRIGDVVAAPVDEDWWNGADHWHRYNYARAIDCYVSAHGPSAVIVINSSRNGRMLARMPLMGGLDEP
jgi:hypothetical protein